MNPLPFSAEHPVNTTPAIWPLSVARTHVDALFRRRFTLPSACRGVRLWVSASQRFQLFLDGTLLAEGPAWSDRGRWGCVSVPVGTLPAGRHVLAAKVRHWGEDTGISQLGGPGFFLLCAASQRRVLARRVDTGPEWRARADTSCSPLRTQAWAPLSPHDVTGPGERICGAQVPWGWSQLRYVDRAWTAAHVICPAAASEWGNCPLGHVLRENPLPAMERNPGRWTRALGPGVSQVDLDEFRCGRGGLTIPASSRVQLRFDRGVLTNAVPVLTVSGGCGAVVRMVTAEAPYDGQRRCKIHRDQIDASLLPGHLDEFLPEGGARREYAPFRFRSFRYLQLEIQTAAAPLTLDRLLPVDTAYPLRERSPVSLQGPGAERYRRLQRVSLQTARCCAHEVFFDCPHYEQAQFPGDSRIQAIYHYVVANEDRLARKAMDDLHASRVAEGLTRSHYPSRRFQILPTFSLYWIGMLHDFLVYRGDCEFLAGYLPFARDVLAWFLRRRAASGMLGRIEYAPFFDWAEAFRCGNAPQEREGGSSLLTLLLARACCWQAALEQAAGQRTTAAGWRREAQALRVAVRKHCYDRNRGLMADTFARRSFSVHAQVEAVLSGAVNRREGRRMLTMCLAEDGLAQPGSFYYRFYQVQAMKACGLHADALALFDIWTGVLDRTGLTTWPETSGAHARSDCHAWSVTPAIEMVQTVGGICPDPGAAGYGAVRVWPCLGSLTAVRVRTRTPQGVIDAEWQRAGGGLQGRVASPVPLRLPGRQTVCPPGEYHLALAAGRDA